MKLSERRDMRQNIANAYDLSNTIDMLIPDGQPDDAPIMLTVGMMQRVATTLAFVSGAAAGMLPTEAECDDDLHEGMDAHGTGQDIG